MTISKGRLIVIVAAAFAAGVVLSLAVMAGTSAALRGSMGGKTAGGLDATKLQQIDAFIDKYYLEAEDVDRQELVDNAYRGYVAGLGDPYSAYMTANETENYEASAIGNYSGVGITFETDENGNYPIVAVNRDSPAEKAGIQAGDVILEVDGEYYSSSDVMASHIRGKKGTEVKLTYLHGKEKKTVTMTRAQIILQSVEEEMLDGETGYIRITQFVDKTGSDFDKALQKIQQQGARKLVLDLRDNGGGLVDDAIDVADQFLDAGVACYVQDKDGKREEYTVKDGKTDLETVVLVNGNSASASEILAGALQDNGFTIVGEKTFGKGIIQTSFDLPEGDSLKLTILEYLTPDKHKVHKKGITPDVKVKDDEDTEADEQLEKAEDLL